MKKKLMMLLTLLCVFVSITFAQVIRVTGIVILEDDGSPVVGASVLVKGTNVATITDVNGQFTLTNVPSSAKTLTISFIGLTTRDVAIESSMRVLLRSTSELLDELIVVGYGTQRKSDLTSSISRVKGEDLANLTTASFDSQLAGRAAGVQVIQPSGVLGAVPSFRVRGVNSLSSSTQPLIIVDGMPVIAGDVSQSYVKSNAMADINPNDIASIEILKDGAATAVYGSRAANGVILITTKKGKKGAATMSYDGYIAVGSPVKTHKLLNASQFVEIVNEKYTNVGDPGQAVYDGTNTNWNDYVYRNGIQHSHTVNLSGGTDKSQYYASLGYTNQEGIIRGNDLERFSLKADLHHEANKWLKVGLSSNSSKTVTNGIVEGGNSIADVSFAGIRMLPNVSVFNKEDATGYNIDQANRRALGRGANLKTIDNNIANIVWVLDNNVNRASTLRSISTAFAEITFLPELKFKTQGGMDMSFVDNYLVWHPDSGDGSAYDGLLSSVNTLYTNWNWQNILSFSKLFNSVHNIDLTALQEYTRSEYKYTVGSVNKISDPYFIDHVITGTYAVQNVYGSKSFNGLASYLFRANYSYDSRYYIGASIRYDGLSRLPKETRWGTFYGGSAAWRISRESFWAESSLANVVNDFRIRGSYATVGNQDISQDISGNFPYLGSYAAGKYGSQNAIYWSNMGNNFLKWETTETFDIGIDAGLFQNRLTLELAYWNKKTKDLVLNVPTAPSLGVPNNQFTQNIGALSNQGVEITLAGTIIDNKNFTWSADLNFSTLSNRVTKLVDGQDVISNYTVVREGEAMNSIYGYDYVGVNAVNGYPIWRKSDGTMVQFDLLGSYNYRVYDPANPSDVSKSASLSASTDRKILGNSIPTWFGGLNNSFTFYGFDANLFIRFSGGNKIMNATRQDLLNMEFSNNGVEVLGRWKSPSEPGNGVVPVISYGDGNVLFNSGYTDSRFVEDGAYLKLANLSIGYTLPRAITQKIQLSKLRFYVQAQNLLTITGYSGLDPEIFTNLSTTSNFAGGFGVDWNGKAQQRTFSFGINATF